MRSNDRLLALAFIAAVAAVCTGACKKSAERKEAAETELRSGQTIDAQRLVIDEKSDLVTVRREQLDLLGRLQAEIDGIDEKLAAMKVELRDGGYAAQPNQRTGKDARRIKELLHHRSQLEADKTEIERADEHGWEELKASIEKDLAAKPPHGQK